MLHVLQRALHVVSRVFEANIIMETTASSTGIWPRSIPPFAPLP